MVGREKEGEHFDRRLDLRSDPIQVNHAGDWRAIACMEQGKRSETGGVAVREWCALSRILSMAG